MKHAITAAMIVAGLATPTPGGANASPTTEPAERGTVALAQCYGSSCNGKDPQTTGCGRDADTIDDFVVRDWWTPETHVELRFSAACYAAWTRVTTIYEREHSDAKAMFSHEVWDSKASYSYRYLRVLPFGYPSDPAVSWTPMTTFSKWHRSCLRYWDTYPEGWRNPCTALH